MFLYRSGRTVFVEIAFGHLRKHNVQHIHFAGEIVAPEINAQIIELAAQKAIGAIDLEK